MGPILLIRSVCRDPDAMPLKPILVWSELKVGSLFPRIYTLKYLFRLPYAW